MKNFLIISICLGFSILLTLPAVADYMNMDNGYIFMRVQTNTGFFCEAGRTATSDPIYNLTRRYNDLTNPMGGGQAYLIDDTIRQPNFTTPSAYGSYSDGFWVQWDNFFGVNIRQDYLIRSLSDSAGQIETILWRTNIWSANGAFHTVGTIIAFDLYIINNDAPAVSTSSGVDNYFTRRCIPRPMFPIFGMPTATAIRRNLADLH